MTTRTVVLLSLFLAGGAIFNVAVAWMCGAFIDLRGALEQFNVSHDPASGVWIADTRRDGFGASQALRRQVRPRSYGVSGDHYMLEFDELARPLIILKPGETIEREGRAKLRTAGSPDAESFLILEPWANSYGWPMRSMCCWLENQSGYPSSSSAARRGPVRLVSGIDLSQGKIGPDSSALPLWPMWPGFAINTFFYAAILLVLFAGFDVLRRRWRVKHGLCPACAYPIGESDICTECGKPVVKRAVIGTN